MEQIIRLQKKLSKQKLGALLISSSYNIGYLTGFFGFSKIEREGYVLLTRDHTYFFASGLNSEAVSEHIEAFPSISLVEISPRTLLTKKALADIIRKEKIKRLGFEKHNIVYSEFERLEKDLKVKLIPQEFLIENLRMIKTPQEIEAIEKACRLGDVTFEYILSVIKEGITEKELAFELEFFIRRHGAEISFPPIVAFGANSSIPHHVSDDTQLTTNSWVLMDFGVKFDSFCSDMTRTVFVGRATKEQRHMYQTVLNSQQKAMEFIAKVQPSLRLNLYAKNVDKVARNYITSQGFPTIPHSLGHGIGLEVHEPPRISPKSKDSLKTGMVFSIEPGIYIPARNASANVAGGPGAGGVRIEDLVVLEEKGPRFLTTAKRKLIEL